VTETIPRYTELTIEQLDERLERAVRENERSEKLMCFYLVEIRDRRGEQAFGFANIWDYAAERFGFSERKTAYLLRLGTKLKRLPHLAEALASGKLGWTKAVKVAEVATPEDEAMWVDSALSLSVRELERRIRDGVPRTGGRISVWLSSEQNAVWQRALEVCRRVSGAELDPGRCLELIAGEFLATYESLDARRDEHDNDGKEDESETTGLESAPASDEPATDQEEDSSHDHTLMCPESDELPSPVSAPYGEIHRAVLQRDGYSCVYPGCSARMCLHVHHVEFRSRSGSKGRARSNSPDNLITACLVHHRMLHSSTIGVKGRAPDDLEWRRPAQMEAAIQRSDRWSDAEDTVNAEEVPFADEEEWAIQEAAIPVDPYTATVAP